MGNPSTLNEEEKLLVKFVSDGLKTFMESGARRIDFGWGSIYLTEGLALRVDVIEKGRQ